jgi:hypothetical protein
MKVAFWATIDMTTHASLSAIHEPIDRMAHRSRITVVLRKAREMPPIEILDRQFHEAALVMI